MTNDLIKAWGGGWDGVSGGMVGECWVWCGYGDGVGEYQEGCVCVCVGGGGENGEVMYPCTFKVK